MSDEITTPNRSGKHRVFLLANITLAVLTILSGSGLLYANWKLNNRKVVTIDSVDPNSRHCVTTHCVCIKVLHGLS